MGMDGFPFMYSMTLLAVTCSLIIANASSSPSTAFFFCGAKSSWESEAKYLTCWCCCGNFVKAKAGLELWLEEAADNEEYKNEEDRSAVPENPTEVLFKAIDETRDNMLLFLFDCCCVGWSVRFEQPGSKIRVEWSGLR